VSHQRRGLLCPPKPRIGQREPDQSVLIGTVRLSRPQQPMKCGLVVACVDGSHSCPVAPGEQRLVGWAEADGVLNMSNGIFAAPRFDQGAPKFGVRVRIAAVQVERVLEGSDRLIVVVARARQPSAQEMPFEASRCQLEDASDTRLGTIKSNLSLLCRTPA